MEPSYRRRRPRGVRRARRPVRRAAPPLPRSRAHRALPAPVRSGRRPDGRGRRGRDGVVVPRRDLRHPGKGQRAAQRGAVRGEGAGARIGAVPFERAPAHHGDDPPRSAARHPRRVVHRRHRSVELRPALGGVPRRQPRGARRAPAPVGCGVLPQAAEVSGIARRPSPVLLHGVLSRSARGARPEKHRAPVCDAGGAGQRCSARKAGRSHSLRDAQIIRKAASRRSVRFCLPGRCGLGGAVLVCATRMRRALAGRPRHDRRRAALVRVAHPAVRCRWTAPARERRWFGRATLGCGAVHPAREPSRRGLPPASTRRRPSPRRRSTPPGDRRCG